MSDKHLRLGHWLCHSARDTKITSGSERENVELRRQEPPYSRMLYMVIERFKNAPAIYQRFREKGRMMPPGLDCVSSWIDHDFKICWQLMRTENPALFDLWIENWNDLMEFEVVPVRTSAEAAQIVAGDSGHL